MKRIVLLTLMVLSIMLLGACIESQAEGQGAQHPSAIIAGAYESGNSVESYRAVLDTWFTFGDEPEENHSQIEFVAPDRYRQISMDPGGMEQSIRIGNTLYMRDDDDPFWGFREEDSEMEFPSQGPGVLLKSLLEGSAIPIDELGWNEKPNEVIDGTVCLYFAGEVDMDRVVDKLIADIRDDQGELDEEQRRSLDQMRHNEQTLELWIGAKDHLIRQEKSILKSLIAGRVDEAERWAEAVLTARYYDFNAPITIEVPADARPWMETMVPYMEKPPATTIELVP